MTAVRARVPLGELREILGRKSLAMVSRYARHVPHNAGDLAREKLNALLDRPVAPTEQPAATAPGAHVG